MTGYAGQAGVAALAAGHREFLLGKLPSDIVQSAIDAGREYPVPDEIEVIARIAVRERGLFRALWLLSEKLQCGLDADLGSVPVRQEAVEICELLDEDIYGLDARGAWIFAVKDADKAVDICARRGIKAGRIGSAIRSSEKVVHIGTELSFLEGPG